MANFPGPTYNRIIAMSADPSANGSQKSGQPSAPEFGIKHV